MGQSMEKILGKRFGEGIEIVYRTRPVDGEERQFNQKKLSDTVKAVMAAVLKREPTPEELLGIVPIVVSRKKGAS